jgi:hypothetical protein
MDLAALERQLMDVARRSRQARATTSRAPRREALAMLQDADATATGCMRALEVLCGPEFRAWEPESIWLTLDRQGADPPVVNRDKILAAITLTMVPAFWWEVHAFENTVLAFNNVVSDHRVVQEATPAQIAWGVYEAEIFYDGQDTPAFDHEPTTYTALVLQRAGFLRAPDLLSFAQRELTKHSRNGAGVTAHEVDVAWSKVKKTTLVERQFSDSALDVQLGRLASVELYVQQRLSRYQADLTRLK